MRTEHLLAPLAAGDPCFDRRVVVVAAHPTTETLSAGAALSRLSDRWVVHATDGTTSGDRGRGASTEEARERRQAAQRALALAGVPETRIKPLGLPARALHEDFRGLVLRLSALFVLLRADAVITHPYEGDDFDNDSVALAVHAATAKLALERRPVPVLVEMASHGRSDENGKTPTFRPSTRRVFDIVLTRAERRLKDAMLNAYGVDPGTATEADREQLRPAPLYDFGLPPPVGAATSEAPWLSATEWRRSARQYLFEAGLRSAA